MMNITAMRDRRGSTSILWALMVLPLLIMVGAALDFSTRETSQRQIRSATDAAAIAAVRYAMTVSDDPSVVAAQAATFLHENLPVNWPRGTITPQVTFTANRSVTVKAVYDVPTTMLGLAGIQTLQVSAESTAVYAQPKPLEIALVLDNSYSMVGQPMTDLKAAANTFIDSLVRADRDTVKVAIVPFSNFVNVGTENRYASWMDVPPDYQPPGTWCTVDQAASEANGCYMQPNTCHSDGQPFSCPELVCPPGIDPVEVCYPHGLQTWYGCVLARGMPLDIQDSGYSSNRVLGRLDWGPNCPAKIRPLTNNVSALKARVSELNADSETMIFEGLAWGLRVLSPQQPFTEGRSYADMAALGGQKILILMSDGENSRSPDPAVPNSDHWYTDIAHADARTLAACTEIRNAGIEIHVIALGLSNPHTLAQLQTCAGDPSRFYNISSSANLAAAFLAISGDLREIALTQ